MGLCGEHRCHHCGERFYKTQSWTWDNSSRLWHQSCAEKDPEFEPQEADVFCSDVGPGYALNPEGEALMIAEGEDDPGWRRDPDKHDIETDYGPDEDIDPEERGW